MEIIYFLNFDRGSGRERIIDFVGKRIDFVLLIFI